MHAIQEAVRYSLCCVYRRGGAMAHELFISYSSRDKAVADEVCHELEERGLRCWIAPRDIPPGAVYAEELMNALLTSRVLVLVFSAHTNGSQHVLREVNTACNKGLTIVPFRIEDVQMSLGLEYYLGTQQWLDAFAPPLEAHLGELADLVRDLLEHHPADRTDRQGRDLGQQAETTVTASSPEADGSLAPLPVSAVAEAVLPATDGEADPLSGAESPLPVHGLAHQQPIANDHASESLAKAAEPSARWTIAKAFSHTLLGVLGVNDCGFAPDGQIVFTAGWPTVKLWTVRDARRLATLGEQVDIDKVTAAAYSPDGRTIAAAGPSQLELYHNPLDRNWLVRVSVIRPRNILRGHAGEVKGCAFSRDGLTLVSAGEDRLLKLWDVATGACRGTLAGHTHEVNDCDFSPDGTTVVSASADMMLRLWDAESGESLAVLSGHNNGVVACNYSPDGSRIASASWDGTLRLWDPATHQCLKTLTGHKAGGVRDCAFSPDGRTLASAGGDTTIKLWDVATGRCEATLMGHSGPVVACAFSPDGRMLISGSSERKKDCVRVWVAS